MITLTSAPEINSVLGGDVPVGFDKLIVTAIRLDSKSKMVNATLLISSTTNAEMQDIAGTLEINSQGSVLRVEVPQLDFYRRVILTAPQVNAIAGIVSGAQGALESGILSLGVLDGVQTSGT